MGLFELYARRHRLAQRSTDSASVDYFWSDSTTWWVFVYEIERNDGGGRINRKDEAAQSSVGDSEMQELSSLRR